MVWVRTWCSGKVKVKVKVKVREVKTRYQSLELGCVLAGRHRMGGRGRAGHNVSTC